MEEPTRTLCAPLQDLEGTGGVSLSPSSLLFHSFRGPRCPRGRGRGSPLLLPAKLPPAFPSPNPFKQTSPLLWRKESQAVLPFCQHGFNWPQSVKSNLDKVQGLLTPPAAFWKRPSPVLSFATHHLPRLSFSPRIRGLLRHQSWARASSDLQTIASHFLKSHSQNLGCREGRPRMNPLTSGAVCVGGAILYSVFCCPLALSQPLKWIHCGGRVREWP